VTIALVVIGDGRRSYLEQSIPSLKYLWNGDITDRILVDDSGDADYHRHLHDTYPDFALFAHPERRGMAAAVATAHEAFLRTGASRAWIHEEDFVLDAPVDLAAMDALLTSQVHLAELALKRDPVMSNAQEAAAGGFMETTPDAYVEHEVAEGWYTETALTVTFNPALWPRRVIQCIRENPGDGVEKGVTAALLAEGYRFAWWGRRADPPRVRHVGDVRSQGWRV
jgi:hypothetical protein